MGVQEAGPPGSGRENGPCSKQLFLFCVCVEGRRESVQRGSNNQPQRHSHPLAPQCRSGAWEPFPPLVCGSRALGVSLARLEGFGEDFAQ